MTKEKENKEKTWIALKATSSRNENNYTDDNLIFLIYSRSFQKRRKIFKSKEEIGSKRKIYIKCYERGRDALDAIAL